MCQRVGMTRMTRGKAKAFIDVATYMETGLFNIVGAVPEMNKRWRLRESLSALWPRLRKKLLILVSPSTCPIICEEWLWRPRWQPATTSKRAIQVVSCVVSEFEAGRFGKEWENKRHEIASVTKAVEKFQSTFRNIARAYGETFAAIGKDSKAFKVVRAAASFAEFLSSLTRPLKRRQANPSNESLKNDLKSTLWLIEMWIPPS